MWKTLTLKVSIPGERGAASRSPGSETEDIENVDAQQVGSKHCSAHMTN